MHSQTLLLYPVPNDANFSAGVKELAIIKEYP